MVRKAAPEKIQCTHCGTTLTEDAQTQGFMVLCQVCQRMM